MAKPEELRQAILRELNIQGAYRENQKHEKLDKEIPSKWVKHGDIIIFPTESFKSWEVWRCYPQLLETIAEILNAKTLYRKTGSILNDGYRTPQIQRLYGTDAWAVKKENGIYYTWNVTKVMFSKGNITEKQRIAKFKCEGQTVVDLYAGIGYFVLPYLIHAKAEKVYAFEWNPAAADALRKSLELNKVADKCVIMEVDNLSSVSLVKNVADHVNLGMIPSSESTWKCGCAILKRDLGGILHIHATVDVEMGQVLKNNLISMDLEDGRRQVPVSWFNWSVKCTKSLNNIFKEMYPEETWDVHVTSMFKIKSYAPYVDHVVFDVKCSPSKHCSLTLANNAASDINSDQL